MAALLLDLPVEVLTCIARHLGPEFFREDVRRLSLCKIWYEIVIGVFLSDIVLKTKTVQYLLERVGEDGSIQLPVWAQHNVRSLTIQLRNVVLCDETGDDLLPHDSADRLHKASDTVEGLHGRLVRRHRAISSLQQLRLLKKLNVDITILDYSLFQPCQNCEKVVWSSLELLSQLTLPCLRELDLSLLVDDASDGQDTDPKEWHTCQAINEVLIRMRNLKEVHLALSFMCPKLFEVGRLNGTIGLEVLHVKSGYMREPESRMVRCGEVAIDGIVEPDAQYMSNLLAKDLALAAKDLASSLQSLKMFRIEWINEFSRSLVTTAALERLSGEITESEYYDLISALGRDATYYLYVWYCLADEVRTFPHRMPWDSDGAVIDLDKDSARWEADWDAAEDRRQKAYEVVKMY